MDGLSQAVMMWQMEAGAAIALLFIVWGFARLAKVWRAPESVSLISILGMGLVLVTAIFLALGGRIHWFTNRYALYFILLYFWSALGLVFFTYRNVHIVKIAIGLVSQAAIIYGLYCVM